MYQLCTRRLPFPGTTLLAVLTALSNDTPPAPHDLNPAIPPALDGLVMQLLAKRPSDRPASARVVVEAIRSIERELQANRQRAELSSAAPPPVVADPSERTPDGASGGPARPGVVAKARRVRRSLGIAAAAVLLGLVAISMWISLRPRGARTIMPDRRVPEVVAAIAPSQAVLQPGPPPSPPAATAPPGPPKPPADAKPERNERLRAAAPDVDPPRQEGPLKPAMREAAKRIEGLSDRSRIIDPVGDCRVLLDTANDRASILVPGIAHLLSAEIDRMNAPRILQEVTGDFEVRVKVTGIDSPGSRALTTRYAPYHGAGILLAKDPGNYIRLEIAADHRKSGTFPYANFELRKDGRLGSSWGLKIEDGSSELRLRRLGDEVRAAFSPDGYHWTSFAPLIADFPDRLEVGIVAVNSATKPLEAHFEGFQLITGPGVGPGVTTGHPPSKTTAPPDEAGPTSPAELGRADRPDAEPDEESASGGSRPDRRG